MIRDDWHCSTPIVKLSTKLYKKFNACVCLQFFVKRWTNYLFSNGCCFIEESTLIDYCKLIAAVGIAVPYTVNPILQKVQCMFHNNVLFVLVCNFLWNVGLTKVLNISPWKSSTASKRSCAVVKARLTQLTQCAKRDYYGEWDYCC